MKEDKQAKILLCGGCETCEYYTNSISTGWPPKLEDMLKDGSECTSIKYFNKMQTDNPVFDTAVEGDEVGLPCSEDGYCEYWEIKK